MIPKNTIFALVGWMLLLVGLGAVSGAAFGPDAWFAALEKPTWNPPSWLFAPVWTTLYAAMGVSLWLVRRQTAVGDVRRRRALTLFTLQFALNMLWTPVFFGLHSPALAFVIICALWAMILATAFAFHKVHAVASYLLVPYLLWVSFALVLNATLFWLNA